MITKAQALALRHDAELHGGTCTVTVGPRGGTTSHTETWRINGAIKTWKTEPDRFRLPLKHGLRDYGYLDETNADYFHLAADCHPVITVETATRQQHTEE